MGKICGAPGCANLTASAAGKAPRRINGVELCRGCYQRIWELSKKINKPMEQIVREGAPLPKRPLPRIETTCAREGCDVELPENAGPNVRRTIGLLHVCNPCYQLAWEHSVKKGVSIEEAFREMKPKHWRPDPPKTVRCCLPWCNGEFVPDESSEVSDGVHACGKCRSYLKVLGQRPRYKARDWKELAKYAIKGIVAAPNTPEMCAMSWCSNVERSYRRGPNGEAICNSDGIYLYQYSRRHEITFEEAFRTAPPPRLLHTRGRNKG